jgi:cardiolipin synthase
MTPANQLTLLRMLLIPGFALLVIYDHLGAALTVFCVAGLTDALDGLIARRTGQKTALGAWLDPTADKLLLVTTFVVLTLPLEHLTVRLPVWLTVLVISRDIGIVATASIISMTLGRRNFTPSLLGKIATTVFILTGVVTLLFNYLGRSSAVVTVFVYASLVVTLLSGLHYLVNVTRMGQGT